MGTSRDNLVPWKTIHDQASFRIVPISFPWRAVIILNTLFVIFAVGWIFAGFRFAAADQHPLILISGISVGLLTCLFFTTFVHYRFRSERARGPWLIFDRASAMLSLPREKRRFPVSQTHLQFLYVQGYSHDEGSELQLVADLPAADGTTQQAFLLMTSIFGEGGPIETLAQAIQTHTPIKVLRIPMKDHQSPRSQP
jgi:hypothetical protein